MNLNGKNVSMKRSKQHLIMPCSVLCLIATHWLSQWQLGKWASLPRKRKEIVVMWKYFWCHGPHLQKKEQKKQKRIISLWSRSVIFPSGLKLSSLIKTFLLHFTILWYWWKNADHSILKLKAMLLFCLICSRKFHIKQRKATWKLVLSCVWLID